MQTVKIFTGVEDADEIEPVENPSEASRSYSSTEANDSFGTGNARSTLDSAATWKPKTHDTNQWMVVDAGT